MRSLKISFSVLALSITAFLANAQSSWGGIDSWASAKKLMSKQKWSEALVILKALEVEHRSPLLAIDISRALTFLGRREEAIRILLDAHERFPRSALKRRVQTLSRVFFQQSTFDHYQEGVRFFETDFKKSRELFEKAIEAESDHVDVLIRLGQVLVLDSQADAAYEKLRYAKSLNPFEPEIFAWLGKAMILRGEISGAIQELNQAVNMRRDHEWSTIWLAQALDLDQKTSEADRVLNRHLKEYPDHLNVLHARLQLRFKNKATSQEILWLARQEVQEALSRFSSIYPTESPRRPSAYWIPVSTPSVLRKSLLDTLQVIEDQLVQ